MENRADKINEENRQTAGLEADTGGSDIDTAAMAHLSLSTPEALRIHTVDFNAWVTVGNATGMPPAEGGRLRAPGGPGLGVEVELVELGEPFGVWS